MPRMDRRKLMHKANGQRIGKSRQESAATRAQGRRDQMDALRQLDPETEPEPEVPVRISRFEKLKQWRMERDAKKKELEGTKKKPFVSSVKRGVFTDKTNYTELNKERRKKAAAKKPNARPANQTTSSTRTAANDTISQIDRTESQAIPLATIRMVSDQTSDHHDVESSTVPNTTVNTTFEMQNSSADSMEPLQTHEAINDPTEIAHTLEVPTNLSTLNTTFEILDEPENIEMSQGQTVIPNQTVKSEPAEPNNDGTPENHQSVEHEIPVPTIKIEPNESPEPNTPAQETTPASRRSTSKSNTSLNYVSPFVTIGRGKGSARKEVQVRESFYKFELSESAQESQLFRQNREAADYFRFQVETETNNLMDKVNWWAQYKSDNDHVDSVYLDQIDVAIGQTKLLINKKFKQFLGLCDECEKGVSQQPVLPKDLEGFWSMVLMQVENCNQRFQKLTTLRDNDWVDVDLLKPMKIAKPVKSKRAAKKGSSSSGIQKMIEEARLKMKANRITPTPTSSSNSDVPNAFAMSLRKTPARLSLSSVGRTPRSIIKTPGAARNVKSVAFSMADSPSSSTSRSPKPRTPMPRVIKRRASTSGIPDEKPNNAAEVSTATFLTPNNRKVTNTKRTPAARRSHRQLFTVAEK